MASGKRGKNRKSESRSSRWWEPAVAGAFAIGFVVVIFMITNRGGEAERSVSSPPADELAAPTTGMTAPLSPAEVAMADRIDVSEVKRMLDEGSAITIDVRDVDSYAAGHIPGALQIPLQYVAGEVPWFPRDRMIITYCT